MNKVFAFAFALSCLFVVKPVFSADDTTEQGRTICGKVLKIQNNTGSIRGVSCGGGYLCTYTWSTVTLTNSSTLHVWNGTSMSQIIMILDAWTRGAQVCFSPSTLEGYSFVQQTAYDVASIGP